MVGLLVLVALAVVGTARAQSQRSVQYRATVRPFMSARCIRNSDDFYDAWDYTARGLSRTSQQSLAYRSNEANCPYWPAIAAGSIDGHPDFQTLGPAIGSGVRTGIVQPTLALATSGLPKVQYCASPPCGCSGSSCPTSNSTYFQSWFNDDARYNKRVGFGLNLFNSSVCTIDPEFGEVCTYAFNSATQDEITGATETGGFFGPLNQFNGISTVAAFPDYRDAPSWPRTTQETGSVNKFWFTTEFHNYFLFRGGEQFDFSGDDDVWVFINGQQVIDLGGVHAAVGSNVLLNPATAGALGLVEGEIYALDLFHAERQTSQSNFLLTTSLGSPCNVLRSGTVALDFVGATATPAEVEEQIFFSRNARFEPARNALLLADAARPAAWSAVFGASQFNVGSGFTARFSFSVDSSGSAEGFAFVMHARPEGLRNLPATTGGNLGVRYLRNSLALVFDLCADRASGPGCARQDVRLHYNSDPDGFNNVSTGTRRVYDDFVFFLPGKTYNVEILYLETPDWLEVYIDDSLYLRQTDFNVARELGGGRNAFVGFTAATRPTAAADVLIESWSVTTVELDTAKTFDVDFASANASEPRVALADGLPSPGFAVRMRDFCENNITYGGAAALLKGVLVELLEPVPDPTEGDDARRALRGLQAAVATTYADGSTTPKVLNATIIDNDDGTYTAALASSVPGTFALYVCAGADCEVNVALDGDENSTDARNATVTFANEDFSASVPRAVRVLPLTARPTTSPTVSAPTQGADTESAVLASSIGGGSALFALLLVGLILFVLRRRWQRDRAFIEDGALYNMEREVTYDKNDEYSTIGRMVMNTTAAIQRERAQKAGGATGADALAAENEELQEQVRINKQKQQEAKQAAAARSVFNRGAKKAVKKKEFQVTAPNL